MVQRVDDEAVRHQIKRLIAGLQGQAHAGRVVAPVAPLQLEHAPPQVPRLVGRHVGAAAFGRCTGLAAAGVLEGRLARGEAFGDEVRRGLLVGLLAAGRGGDGVERWTAVVEQHFEARVSGEVFVYGFQRKRVAKEQVSKAGGPGLK